MILIAFYRELYLKKPNWRNVILELKKYSIK